MRPNIVSESEGTRGNIPVPESQRLKTLKVTFRHATKDKVVTHNVSLDRQSTVRDVPNDQVKGHIQLNRVFLETSTLNCLCILGQVELSHSNAELRLLEVFYHKIYKIFPLNEKIENINGRYWTLRAEEVPEEEKNLGPHERLIHVYHFTKDTTQKPMLILNFGDPFFLVIHDAETLAEVKLRIQKQLRVPDEEFSKWKVAFVTLGRPAYLKDTDNVSSHFQRQDVYGAWEQYLGLEHSDTGRKRAYAANQRNKDVKKFCEKGVNVLLEEEGEQLYRDYATGDKVYVPTMEPQFVNIKDGEGDQEGNHCEDRSSEEIDSQASKQAQKSQPKVNSVQMMRSRKRSAGSIMLSTRHSELVSCCKKMIGDGSSTVKAKQPQSSTISTAMKMFNRMVESGAIDKGSDIWFYTLSMLEDAVKREIFSNMLDDSSRLLWLNHLYKEKEDE